MVISKKQMDGISNFHYDFGIHSNIPKCCVRFYVDMVTQGEEHIGLKYRPEYFHELDKYLNIRYVTCDECHDKVMSGTYTPNKVHSCRREPNEDCEKYLREVT
jgi:hypothetical protein